MKKLLLILPFASIIFSSAAQIPGNYQPMPIPQWQVPTSIRSDGSQMIRHDLLTGTDLVSSEPPSTMASAYRSEPFNPGIQEVIDSFPGIKNFNDLSLISDPTPYPWCTNVKLFMTFPNAAEFVGSGVMINSSYVITAGHCVYSSDNGGWASEIIVAPAYNGGSYPYGVAYAEYMYSWTGWTSSQDYDWDMGYIELATDIGTTVGWLGFGYDNDDNFFYTNTFNNPGYPAEAPYDGSEMYYWYGTYDDVQTHRLYFTKYCYGGQSGSGSYYKDVNDDRYVYAILSHQLGAQTGHIRINSDKFNSMYNQIFGRNEIDKKLDKGISVYPNPSSGDITIEGGNGPYRVIVTNVMGEIVLIMENYAPGTNLHLAGLPAGIYSIACNADEAQYNERVVLTR